jgi:hypothetical protein
MSLSHNSPRAKRGRNIALELLEGRQVLSAGMGSTFAIMPGTIDKAGQVASVQFKLDPSQFTAGRQGKIVLGIDVAADTTTGLKPQIVSIRGADGKVAAKIQQSFYSQSLVRSKKLGSPMSSAVLATLPVPKAGQAPMTYSVQVQGLNGTTGKYLVGFYLPGDAAGAGTVTPNDLKTMLSKLGTNPNSSNYSFDADANRDGRITSQDLQFASRNLGAKTMVSPIIDVNLDPATDGPLKSRVTSSRVVRFTGTATPGATITFAEANKNSPGATTKVDAAGKYSINVPLGDGANTFQVTTDDAFGQSIKGQIAPVTYSTNPPKVINTPADLVTLATSQNTVGQNKTS